MQETVPGSGIFTIDADYVKPGVAAIHLLEHAGELALVDTGTQYSVASVEQALNSMGARWSDLRYIILTHVHLDHAGGASAMMALASNAQLVVHPRGARHMINPAKLIAGSKAVYGEQAFADLYGEIQPIAKERVRVPADGDVINWNGRALQFIDTPGHASHHFCIWDESTASLFTGDTMGVAYQALRHADRAFVMPSTTPVQFDPEALHASLNRLMVLQPQYCFLTHYSVLRPTAAVFASLHEQIDDYVTATAQSFAAFNDAGAATAHLADALGGYLQQRCKQLLPELDDELIGEWVQFDAALNAQGLAFWWQHKRVNN